MTLCIANPRKTAVLYQRVSVEIQRLSAVCVLPTRSFQSRRRSHSADHHRHHHHRRRRRRLRYYTVSQKTSTCYLL